MQAGGRGAHTAHWSHRACMCKAPQCCPPLGARPAAPPQAAPPHTAPPQTTPPQTPPPSSAVPRAESLTHPPLPPRAAHAHAAAQQLAPSDPVALLAAGDALSEGLGESLASAGVDLEALREALTPEALRTLEFVAASSAVATLSQCLTGFGFGMVAVGILGPLQAEGALPGLPFAAIVAVVILLSVPVTLAQVWEKREYIELEPVSTLLVAALLGTPVGVLSLNLLDEEVVLTLLGIVIVLFSASELSNLYQDIQAKKRAEEAEAGDGEGASASAGDLGDGRPPVPAAAAVAAASVEPAPPGRLVLDDERWAPVFGGLAGILGGAFAVPSPFVVMYAALRRWDTDPMRCKANLVFVLAAMRTLVTLIDAARGEYSDPVVLSSVVACAPACVLAYQLAGLLEGKVNPTLFRGLVVGKLMLNGLILLAPAAIELAAQAADKQ